MKDFLLYPEALALKELGFDEPCFGEFRQWDGSEPYLQLYQDLSDCSTDPADYEYTTECLAPTYSQAFRFFREKYKVVGIVKFGTNEFTFNIYNSDAIGLLTKESLAFNGTYEEAELACLQKLIELVKNKQS